MIVTQTMAEDAARELLIDGFFLQGLTAQIVNEAYRSRARETHPDAGGTAEEFAKVDRAKAILLKWLTKEPEAQPQHGGGQCPRCKGKGFTELQRGFARPLRVQCSMCRGAGELGVNDDLGEFRG